MELFWNTLENRNRKWAITKTVSLQIVTHNRLIPIDITEHYVPSVTNNIYIYIVLQRLQNKRVPNGTTVTQNCRQNGRNKGKQTAYIFCRFFVLF